MHKALPIEFGGYELWLHSAKLIWIPAFKLLCAADIHLEKGSFFGRFATLLPPYDTEETLSRLEKWIAHFQPETFIALGDSFHDAKAEERLQGPHRERLFALVSCVKRWIWITGNHDPLIGAHIPGDAMSEAGIGGIRFLHELLKDNPHPQICGHYHPKAAIHLRGQRISTPCFLLEGNKLIMPSFGAFTGGLDSNSPVLMELMNPALRKVYLTHREDIYRLGDSPFK